MTEPVSAAVVQPAGISQTELAAAFGQFETLGRRRLDQAIVIGEMLARQKKACGHGNWLPWLKANAPFGRQRAADFIRVHENRGKCSHATTFEEALGILAAGDSDAVTDNLEVAARMLKRIADEEIDPATPLEVLKSLIQSAEECRRLAHTVRIDAMADLGHVLLSAEKEK